MRRGAVVLCGGRSTRMGRDKAALPLAGESMLGRAVRLVSAELSGGPLVVVAAERQQLPRLPSEVEVCRDERDGLGPMEGLRVGLFRLADRVDAAFLVGCDTPLLATGLVGRLFGALDDFEAAVPRAGERLHPLAAVYRPSVLQTIEALLAARDYRMTSLVAKCHSRILELGELGLAEGGSDPLLNVNTPEEYAEAVRRLEGGR